MDALKINTRVIAVPNTDLMGNHQVEMAEDFAKQGWLIHGQLGYVSSIVFPRSVTYYLLCIYSKIHEAVEQSATFKAASYPPKPPPGSENRGLEQITQDVVNGTWHGTSGSKYYISSDVMRINANWSVQKPTARSLRMLLKPLHLPPLDRLSQTPCQSTCEVPSAIFGIP